MIIVADTSPLNYLILIDRISILETLYRRIMVAYGCSGVR
jgi:predicted nucleic acid-binding protein